MPQALSPYALLRASRPKPTPTLVTPYDLYSAAYADYTETTPTETAEIPRTPQTESPAPAAAAKPLLSYTPTRTHYIADIHARHNKATLQSLRRR